MRVAKDTYLCSGVFERCFGGVECPAGAVETAMSSAVMPSSIHRRTRWASAWFCSCFVRTRMADASNEAGNECLRMGVWGSALKTCLELVFVR